jgi:hypothetical protein
MNELEQQAVIKFLWKEGYLAKNIHGRLQAIYGDTVHALPSVYKVFNSDRSILRQENG